MTGVTRTHVVMKYVFFDYTSHAVGTSVNRRFVWSDPYAPYLILSAVESSPLPSQLKEVLSVSVVQSFKLIFQVSLPPVIFPTQRFCADLSPIHGPNQILRLFSNYYVTMPQQSKS